MKKLLSIFCLSILLFTSCEDPVDLEIDQGISQLAVDAFLNDKEEKQSISLKKSKDFFSANDQQNVSGALVKVVASDGKEYLFIEEGNSGVYSWEDSVLAHEGIEYSLQINYNNKLYTATESANPVPEIDSLVVSELENGFTGETFPDTFEVELFAIDIAGRQDNYWIKIYRNEKPYQVGTVVPITYDGAFGPGADGVLFIPPIRQFANDREKPYFKGEKVRVELNSISLNTYLFFQQVNSQINNGGLFAVPPSNVRTNIISPTDKLEEKAIGMFSVSLTSFKEVEI